MLKDRILINLEQLCFVSKNDKVVLGFSGGADSSFLLDIFHKLGFSVEVVYFNHQLREASKEEVSFAKKVAKKYGFPCHTSRKNISSIAKKTKRGIEETARHYRYKYLVQVANETKAKVIAVAHHADDQIETILQNTIRGTGLKGLTGMDYFSFSEFSSTIPIIRPILNIWKEEIYRYCDDNNLTYLTDETNLQDIYFRNKVRSELIPVLAKYNPNIKNSLLRMSQILRDDHTYIFTQGEIAKQTSVIEKKKDFVKLDLGDYRKLQISLQRQIINSVLIEKFGLHKDRSFNLIEDLRKVLTGDTLSHFSKLAHGIQVVTERKVGYIFINESDLQSNEDLYLAKDKIQILLPSQTMINEFWELKVERVPFEMVKDHYKNNKNNYLAFLDEKSLSKPLHLRKWKDGDRYSPLGMSGHSMKVSDFWINKGVPKRLRRKWPLLFSGNELVWIPGFQPSNSGKITDPIENVIRLEFSKIV